jgi:Zn-dependent protease with chaperone function
MTFKPATWYPIAIFLSVANVIAIGFASGAVHGSAHGALAVAFGIWALRLGRRRESEADESSLDRSDAIESLEAEMIKLRQELIETQERLDFAERMLAQRPDPRRVGPQP